MPVGNGSSFNAFPRGGTTVRIGLVSTPWVPVPPPAYGGLEAIVDRLARGLEGAGHEVVLAAPGNSDCPVSRVKELPAVDPEAGITGDTVTEMTHVSKAYAAMADMDIIHDHTIAGPLYRHRPPDTPIVTTNHGPFEPSLNHLYQRMATDTAIVAISHNQAASAQGVPIARVIHHGLDVHRIPVGDGSGGFAVFLGRMSPDKGAREAIIVARQAGIPLRMAAKMREGEEHDYFDDQIAPLLSAEIEYVGEVDEVGKYELLGDAIALLNPIQWPEPFGLVMIEALACGTPVVATSAGSVPEIIDNGTTGYIHNDLAELAESLVEVTRLDRSRCREVAESRFSTERMVSDHESLYETLLQWPGRIDGSDVIVPPATRAAALVNLSGAN
jgi:glycosyltransferase involved in cell wall biosynthesis